MSTKKTMVIAISFAMLIIMGALLTIFNINTHNNFDKNITLQSSTNGSSEFIQTERLEMVVENVVPGGKPVEYTINLDNRAKDTFKITLTFLEKDGEILKDFVDVAIGIKGEEKAKFNGKLTDLYDKRELVLGEDVSNSATIYVKFSVDKGVGNVIQSKESSFEVVLTAKKI